MECILRGPTGYNIPNISYGEYILHKLRNAPMKIVQIDAKSEKLLTNHDLLKQSVRLAIELEKMNMKCGNTIAISSENSLNYFIAVCATLFTGATISPINPAYMDGEIKHCLNITKPQIIFVSRRTVKLISEVIKTLSWKIELIQLDNDTELNDINNIYKIIQWSKKYITDDDIKNYNAGKISRPAEHEVVILFSSGTTGLPKGVMLSSRGLISLWYSFSEILFSQELNNTVYLMFLPFFHGYGFSLLILIMTIGSQAIIMDSFDPELFCKSVEKYKVTTLPLVPPIMIFLAKHPLISKYNFSSVNNIICGAAPLPTNIRDEVQDRLGNNVNIRNAYGMTELTIGVTANQYKANKVGTIGCLLPGVTCKVIDPETSESLGENKTGEFCFKGDCNMLGYKDNVEATNQTIDSDGWLHTGDLGYYDSDGYLFIVGRLKELIKCNGYQIAPVEIENILLTNVDVDDAAVYGQNDDKYGEIPVALVVLKPNATTNSQQLCDYVNERISRPKQLRGGVKIVKSIPKNSTGKILRRELSKITSKL